jgi:tetrapyrrole methylase family protein/MazG family protein
MTHRIDPSLPPFEQLLQVMTILRAPDGCSWDREQTHHTLKKFVMEEAAEVCEAVDKNDPLPLCEELGDLMMMVAFHAQIAREAGTFTMDEVLKGIVHKLVSRHPHVFGDREGLTSDRVIEKWKELKVAEKKHRNRISSKMREAQGFASAHQAALKVQAEAATVGFDFPDLAAALDKITEEAGEVIEAAQSTNPRALFEEIGDLLFSVTNVARLAKINPEEALRATTDTFITRFTAVEEHFEPKGGMKGRSIAELDKIWDQVKQRTE